MNDPVWAVEPCRQCHPELHRSQCAQGGCVATPSERLIVKYEHSIVDLTFAIHKVRELAQREKVNGGLIDPADVLPLIEKVSG